MRTFQLAIASLAVVTTLGLHATEAQANCAMPRAYQWNVEGNTVRVCAQADCGSAGALLREDVATGQVVQLSNCEATDAGAFTACWVDECVPEGKYHYGLATPYSCCVSCCGTYYYGSGMGYYETEVTTPLGSCTPTGEAPVEFADKPPWDGKGPGICAYAGVGGSQNEGTGGSSQGTGGAVNGAGGTEVGVGGAGVGGAGVAGAAGTADDRQADPGDDSGGCSFSGGGLNRTVLGIHALALALGLMFASRSRTRRS